MKKITVSRRVLNYKEIDLHYHKQSIHLRRNSDMHLTIGSFIVDDFEEGLEMLEFHSTRRRLVMNVDNVVHKISKKNAHLSLFFEDKKLKKNYFKLLGSGYSEYLNKSNVENFKPHISIGSPFTGNTDLLVPYSGKISLSEETYNCQETKFIN